MSWKKAIIFSFVFFTFLGFGFYSGFYFGKSQCKVCPPQNIDFSLFWEVYDKLKEKFVEKEKIDNQKILEGAISGMVKSLGDPYTVFLNAEETKRFMEDVKGTFEGIGVEIGVKKGQLQIIAPLEGTPAQRAGLKSGDIILKINGQFTMDMTLEEAISLLRGPKGTKVRLTIQRKEWEEPKEIEIVRDIIEIPSLRWEIKDYKGEKIIYLKLFQFLEKTSEDFKKAAYKILKIPTKKMILDLRDNPGGYLEVAVDVAGWFLEKGKPVVIEDFGQEKKTYSAQGPSLFSDYKLVVLINGGSASAAEILAGALKDNKEVLLIGEKTFGKGTVQELISFKDGSSLKVTVGKWLTPKGNLIAEKGLTPDIEIENNEDEFQLQRALEILKNL
jgi:carboxyl-terminal processing protease